MLRMNLSSSEKSLHRQSEIEGIVMYVHSFCEHKKLIAEGLYSCMVLSSASSVYRCCSTGRFWYLAIRALYAQGHVSTLQPTNMHSPHARTRDTHTAPFSLELVLVLAEEGLLLSVREVGAGQFVQRLVALLEVGVQIARLRIKKNGNHV